MVDVVYTTGVYGKTESRFFGQIESARIQLFCDIRQRRGVRGSEYRFVNSTYLQRALSERGIGYRYVSQLAPTREIREAQHLIDQAQGVSKRARTELGEEFKRRYVEEILDRFDTDAFCRSLDPNVRKIVLFCVEGMPTACHRSLVSERLHLDWNVPVENL